MAAWVRARARLAKPPPARHHPAMLRLFGPDCSPVPIDPAAPGTLPSAAIWVDLLNPTKDEEKIAERIIGFNIPTREDMMEIEPSSRLYERGGVTVMTFWALYGTTEKKPGIDPVSLMLTDQHLVTIRYVDPTSFVNFAGHLGAEPDVAEDPLTVTVRLMDAVVDRLADTLESATADLESLSERIFDREMVKTRRKPERHYERLMLRIGATQRLLAKIRESTVSVSRLLGFLAASDRVSHDSIHARHLKSLLGDARALNDHSDFVAENLNFLLDAALGMISLEQNFVMKLFSVF
ncbi:MAG: CorA family divalent cation transporter, partial [Pseudomonadota bacterium]